MVGILGFAAAAGAVWSVVSRGGAPLTVVDANVRTREVPAPLPADPVMVARAEVPTSSNHNTEKAAEAPGVGEHEVNPAGRIPSGPVSTAPEPRIVERRPLGPEVPDELLAPEPAVREDSPLPLAMAPAQPTVQSPSTATEVRSKAAVQVPNRRININSASKAELELLPGVGPALADRIIEARSKKRFANLTDVDKVRGIGPKMLEKLRDRVLFEDPPSPTGR